MKAPLEIEMTPVESSNVAAVGHHPATNTLRVEFHSGNSYDYLGVPAEKHEALLKAESIGSHFHKHIRNIHTGVKCTA